MLEWPSSARFFKRMAKSNWGQLTPKIYYALYKDAFFSRGNILEIGAGFGAGTTALAMGIRDSGSARKVISVESFDSPSIARFGSKLANYEKMIGHLKAYGVRKYVHVFKQKLTPDSYPAPTKKFGMVFIDCDGHLERDFRLFGGHIINGASIIIDDYGPQYTIKYTKPKPLVLQKFLFTYELVHKLMEWGILSKVWERGRTAKFKFNKRGMKSFSYNELVQLLNKTRTFLRKVAENKERETRAIKTDRGVDAAGISYVTYYRRS